MSKLILGACALLAAVVVGMRETMTTTPCRRPSSSEQANAICAKGDKQINAEAEKVFSEDKQPSDAQLEKFAAETAIPNIQAQIDDVRDLEPPSEDEDQITEFLDAAQEDLDRSKEDPAFLVSDASFNEANRLGKSYGLDQCAGD